MKVQQALRNPRLLVGGVVALAVVVILATKLSPSGGLFAARVRGESPPTPVAAGDAEDPYPEDPADQVEWVLRNGKPAMILFHSTTCIPCIQMEELVEVVRGDYEPEIVFVDVITNDRANAGLVREAGIRTIPTSFFLNAAGEMSGYVGAFPEASLRKVLSRLIGKEE